MKKNLLAVMCLMMSSTAFSQTTITKNTKCFSDAQINQLYVGLKQGQYLKDRLLKTETALSEAGKLIDSYKSRLDQKDTIIISKEATIISNNTIYKRDIVDRDTMIEELRNTIIINNEAAAIDSKKKKKNGLLMGSAGGILLGIIGILIIK